MKRTTASILSVTCVVMLQSAAGFAADTQIPVPSGWTPSPFLFAGSQNNVAVALDQGDPVIDGSRVMQAALSGATVLTDIVGKVSSLEYAPDGNSLLVHHVDASASRVTLLGVSGVMLWTKIDQRAFFFSTTGEMVCAWKGGGEIGYGNEVEIFDLSGTTVRKVTADGPLVGAVVVGNGDAVILAVGRTLMRVRTAGDRGIEWTVHSDNEDPNTVGLIDLGIEDRFVVMQEYAHFEVRNLVDGSLAYDYDPQLLAAAGGAKTEYQYAQYDPYAAQLPTRLLLSDNTSNGMLLNLSTGTLVSKPMNVTTPPGFTLLREIIGSKRLLVGSTEIRIRPMVVVIE